jgi:hypothetical protein
LGDSPIAKSKKPTFGGWFFISSKTVGLCEDLQTSRSTGRGLPHSKSEGAESGANLSQRGEGLVHETHQATSMLSFTQLAN